MLNKVYKPIVINEDLAVFEINFKRRGLFNKQLIKKHLL